MAYELIPTIHGAILRAILEDTYNNGASVPDANVFFCSEGAAFNSWVPEMKARVTQAAFLSGVKPSLIKATGAYSGEFPLGLADVSGVTLSPAASIAGVPPCHTLLCGGGFVPTHDNSGAYSGLLPPGFTNGAGNDEILTYTYFPRNTNARSSVAFKYSEVIEGGAKTRDHILNGARHNWSLSCPGGDEWILSIEGMSLAALKTIDSSPSLNDGFPSSEDPVVGMGANYALTKIAASAVTYGGGSEASPSLEADVYGLEIASNMTINAKTAPSGTYGVSKCQYNATTPTATFTIDKVTFEDTFDIDGFTSGRLALRFTQVTPMPGSTTTFLKIQFLGFVTALEDGEQDGYRNTQVTLQLGYPETGTDDGGIVPDELLTMQLVTLA